MRTLLLFFILILFLDNHEGFTQILQSGGGIKPQCAGNPVQGITNDGRDFFLGMLYPSYNTIMSSTLRQYFQVFAFVTTYYDNKITVAYYDDQGKESNPVNYSIPAKRSVKILLDVNAMKMKTDEEKAAYKSCHITSKYPVTIQYMSIGACSGGSYLALPVPGLGRKYIVASYNDNPGNGAYFGDGSGVTTFEKSAGEFEIVATENNTKVTITSTTKTIGGHTGVRSGANANGTQHPYSITLSRGECYLVKSDGEDDNADISGSLIESTKPVAVIAGHENANLGGAGNYNLEARDFMIEQMVPVELWDSVGFISIPLKEGSPSSDEGVGDNYRIYSYDTTGSHIHITTAEKSGGVDMLGARFNDPIPEFRDAILPVTIGTTNGKKISVMQYDERSQPDNFPFPAPSMMTVIPQSRWKYSYDLYVPGNESFAAAQDYYINVLTKYYGTDYIHFTFNGGNVQTLSSLTKAGGFNSINGSQYKLQPGSYHFYNSDPFMIYSYGMRVVSINQEIGDNTGDDFFFEYALPAGMKLSTGIEAPIQITVDTLCTSWRIHLQDSNKINGGIKEIFLLDDPEGIYYSYGYGHQDAKYKNVRLDISLDPLNNGYFNPDLQNKDTFSFYLNINDPLLEAFAVIVIIDNLGNARLLDLHQNAPGISFSTSPIPINKPDSIVLLPIKIGESICTSFVFKNLNTTNEINPVEITSAIFKHPESGFSIATFPHIPIKLYPSSQYGYYNDSLLLNLCFTPNDSLRHYDTLIVSSNCFSIPIVLEAKGMTGLIEAEDANFGTVVIGDTAYKNIEVKNIGGASFSLLKLPIIDATETYSFERNSKLQFPLIIKSGQTINFKLSYHPQQIGIDTQRILWPSNLDMKYSGSIKNYSILRGTCADQLEVQSPIKKNYLRVTPNPVSGNSVLLTFPYGDEKNKLIIYDVLGREIIRKENISDAPQIKIPIKNLSNGTYYVKLLSKEGILTQSFVVNH
jgi:hypothetical protein